MYFNIIRDLHDNEIKNIPSSISGSAKLKEL